MPGKPTAYPLAAVFCYVLLGLVPQSSLATAGETFTLVEHGTRSDGSRAFDIVDFDPKGPSPGDMETLNKELYDKDNIKLLGHMNGWCVRTVPYEVWECIFTVILADGQMALQGPFYDKTSDSVFTVTGGTGKYVNTRGEMKSVERGDASLDYDDIFTLQ